MVWVRVCVCFKTHAEVSVPDLDGTVLAASCNELSISAVGAACGRYLLPLEGTGFEHRLVLLVRVQVPCSHSAADKQMNIFS